MRVCKTCMRNANHISLAPLHEPLKRIKLRQALVVIRLHSVTVAILGFRHRPPIFPVASVLQYLSMSQNLATPVLELMLEPVTRSLNVDVAKKLVRLKADAKVQARVAKLARKCNEGELTPEEAAEYDRYIAFADFVAILQAKARLLLANSS